MKRWGSWAMSAVPVFFLVLSAGMKLARPAGFAEGFGHLGWPVELASGLAVLEIACVVAYLVPRTTVFGAILITGYLGGATAAHVRVGDPFFAPPLLIAMVWGGLYLRDARVRDLLR
jgi:hypothetical protein